MGRGQKKREGGGMKKRKRRKSGGYRQPSARLLRSSGRLRRLDFVWDDEEITV